MKLNIMQDLQGVIKPLPATRKERLSVKKAATEEFRN